MFNDARSKRLIFVAHCILNQNAKLHRCAFYPGAIRESAQAILDSGTGIVQMPCPEMLCLGLDRRAESGTQPSVEAEDERIAGLMGEPGVRQRMRTLIADLVYQVEEYHRYGFVVLGVLGINGSPSCAVESMSGVGTQTEPGKFIDILQEELKVKGISLPMYGIRASQPEEALQVVEQLVG